MIRILATHTGSLIGRRSCWRLWRARNGSNEAPGRHCSNEPISKWHEMSPFETLLDCEKAQHELLAKSRAGSPQAGAQCVATDDPRLK